MFIIDGKELFMMAFNFTHLDINLSRSFAISTTQKKVVAEAVKLFECDSKRTPYTAGSDDFIVSPVNARERLVEFIRGAKKQLLMYEMKISDAEFIKLLNEKVSQGVDVRVIGSTTSKGSALPSRKLQMRLHARAIFRDGRAAFVGSQSLRKLELEARREIGLIVHDPKIVKKMVEVFDKDWRNATPAAQPSEVASMLNVPAKKVAKKVVRELNVTSAVEQVIDRAIERSDSDSVGVEAKELAENVRDAMRDEVQEAVTNALHEMVAAAANAPAEESTKSAKATK
jgi:phosphatidylserine/phosphatidylglycerophosphate/cardiolipin synthase-like enzyme